MRASIPTAAAACITTNPVAGGAGGQQLQFGSAGAFPLGLRASRTRDLKGPQESHQLTTANTPKAAAAVVAPAPIPAPLPVRPAAPPSTYCAIHMGKLPHHLPAVPLNLDAMLSAIAAFLQTPVWLDQDQDVHVEKKYQGYAILYIPREALPRVLELHGTLQAIASGKTATYKPVVTPERRAFLEAEECLLQPLLGTTTGRQPIELNEVTSKKVLKATTAACALGLNHVGAAKPVLDELPADRQPQVRCPCCQKTWMRKDPK
jgi:hypothetical protein